MNRTLTIPAALATLAAGALAASATGQAMEDVQITTTPVAGNVYMLQGRGGNIGLTVGDDGAFLIDDQFEPLTEKILAAVRELTDRPVAFVVNTHWHGDHTGGNENLGEAGAIIVAHENVRARMSEEQFIAAFNARTAPAPEAALPVVTFADSVTFHWNGDTMHVFHVATAHTDGDSIIHFKKSNVIHMGDTFFNEMYPFIDVSTGGTVDGILAAVDRALTLTDANTKVIPGHGALTDAAGLRRYRAMLTTVRDRARDMIASGMSRDDVIAAKPTRDLDATWGGGFLDADRWTGIVYDAMTVGR